MNENFFCSARPYKSVRRSRKPAENPAMAGPSEKKAIFGWTLTMFKKNAGRRLFLCELIEIASEKALAVCLDAPRLNYQEYIEETRRI